MICNAKITGIDIYRVTPEFYACTMDIEFDKVYQCVVTVPIENKVPELMNALDATSLHQLKGQYIRLDVDEGKIIGIGNIIKDIWVSV